MNKRLAIIASIVILGASSSLFANADDTKWISQCIKDNKDSGAKEEVVYKYCACMNDKMSSSETLSISQWEKKNPKEMKDCEKKAGWR